MGGVLAPGLEPIPGPIPSIPRGDEEYGIRGDPALNGILWFPGKAGDPAALAGRGGGGMEVKTAVRMLFGEMRPPMAWRRTMSWLIWVGDTLPPMDW